MVIETVAMTETEYWPPPQGEWRYEDYLRLPDNGLRYEVIKGALYMTPSPGSKHQRAIARLYGKLWDYLQEQPEGEALFTPLDMRLPELNTTLQPDLLFIAGDRLDIIKENCIEGAPDLIMEVISPGNPDYDRRTKFYTYAQAGVREYWLVDPEARTIDIYVLRGQAYALLGQFGPEAQTRSEVLAGFSLLVEAVCPA